MTKDNEDALRCAKRLERSVRGLERMHEIFGQQEPKNGIADRQRTAAAHLRRLVAENEAMLMGMRDREDRVDRFRIREQSANALLRQAVEALERATTGWHRDGQPRLSVDMDALPVADAALSAIRQHLEGKA